MRGINKTEEIEYKRGDIYYFQIEKTQENVQHGKRPCVIIQNDIGNKYGPTIIVSPITTYKEGTKILPTHVILSYELKELSVIKCEQPMTVNKKSRISEKIATLPDYIIQEINQALGVSLALC